MLLNKVMVVGNLCDEPARFGASGTGIKFRIAINDRKKDRDTGEWKDDPIYMDVDAFNSGENDLVGRIEARAKTGTEVYVEGRLKMETWEDKNGGGTRSKIKLIANGVQVLSRGKDEAAATPPAEAKQAKAEPAKPAAKASSAPPKAAGKRAPVATPPDDDGDVDQIPF